jgi:DnaK suppressor protein
MLDQNTLNELKDQLLKEKEELERNLSKIAKPIDKAEGDYETNFDVVGDDDEDNATEVDMYSDNLPVENTLEKRLQDIIEALERMEKGAYGTCENCNKEIDIERLKANPAAKACTKC